MQVQIDEVLQGGCRDGVLQGGVANICDHSNVKAVNPLYRDGRSRGGGQH